MQRMQILRVAAILIVLLSLCAQVAEVFDNWDDSLQTGSDTEFALVIALLTIGASILLARAVALIVTATPGEAFRLQPAVIAAFRKPFQVLIPIDTSPPALRI